MTMTTAKEINEAKRFCEGILERESTRKWIDSEYDKFSGFISYMYYIDKIDDNEMEALRDWLCDEMRKVKYGDR